MNYLDSSHCSDPALFRPFFSHSSHSPLESLCTKWNLAIFSVHLCPRVHVSSQIIQLLICVLKNKPWNNLVSIFANNWINCKPRFICVYIFNIEKYTIQRRQKQRAELISCLIWVLQKLFPSNEFKFYKTFLYKFSMWRTCQL